MNNLFSFGEKIPEYDMKVLNEREVRASAGILFLFAMISFLNSWLIGDFTITKIFVVVFLVEFSIRVLINPKYAPLLVISRFFVRNQEVEYVGAPQKRFAWLIGLVLAVVMFYLVVLNNLIGPFNLLVCVICLTLLFFEAAFGICLGCKIYNLFHKEKAQLCPGNACAIKDRVAIQNINPVQWALIPMFLGAIFLIANSSLIHANTKNTSAAPKSSGDCEIPDWVKKIGHDEKWKLHNGCAGDEKKENTEHAVEQAVSAKADAAAPVAEQKLEHKNSEQNSKPEKDCTVPQFAIDLGHEDQWKLHNGCADAKPAEAVVPKVVAPPKAVEVPKVEHDAKSEKDCTVPQFAIDLGHVEKWKLHNGCQ